MNERQERSVCPLDCPSACSLILTLNDNRLEAVDGNPDHPFTQGVICGKIRQYPWKAAPENRILYPMKRTGKKGEGEFSRISWEEATQTITQKIQESVAQHGGESLLQFYYGGTMGLVQRHSGNLLFDPLGSTRLDLTICSKSGGEGWALGVGGRAKPPEEALQSRMIILWGINAAVTHINFMTIVKEARKKGAKIVVVDPYRNPTAQKADRHYRVLPGTDAALCMGMANQIFQNGWDNREFLDQFCDGVEEFRSEAEKFPPERTAEITGLSPEEVMEFARDYGTLSPTFIRVGLGLSRQMSGWNTTRLIGLLPALTGEWNRKGGGALLFTSGLFPLKNGTLSVKDRPAARSLNMIQLGEALTAWGDPPIRFLYVHSSNPASVVPNQGKVLEGLMREDLFTVVHEQNMTETTRYADLVLPATFMFEHDDYYSSYGQTTLQYGPKLCEPPGEAKSNLEVFSLLESALNLQPRRYHRSVDDFMIPQLKNGKGTDNPIDLDKVKTKGWVSLQLDGVLKRWERKFPNSIGKARFVAPELKEKGFPEVATYIEAGLDFEHPFRLLTTPSVNLLNSTFSSIPKLVQKGGSEPHVLIHPEDANRLGAESGSKLKLWNSRGEILLSALVTKDVLPGVLVCESIWRNDHTGKYGINLLTSDEPIPIGGTAAFHGSRVSAQLVPSVG